MCSKSIKSIIRDAGIDGVTRSLEEVPLEPVLVDEEIGQILIEFSPNAEKGQPRP